MFRPVKTMHRMRWLIPVSAVLALFVAGTVLAVVNARPAAITVGTTQFLVDWPNLPGGDPEQIDAIHWMGGPNLTMSFPGGGGDVEYFGNSWAPPEISVVLVGAGSTGIWAQGPGNSVVITSSGPAGVDVKTIYRLWNGSGPPASRIKVTREFLFTTPFLHDFRPYMPRLYPRDRFYQVLHPDANYATLQVENVGNCEYGGSYGAPGCVLDTTTSPHSWNGNSQIYPNWFAIYNPFDDIGVIVRRDPTPSFSVALWIDQDGGSWSNVSSVLLRQPTGGFTGKVKEVEFLCFYNSSTWLEDDRNNLVLPPGCGGESEDESED